MEKATPAAPGRARALFAAKRRLIALCVGVAVAEAVILEILDATWAARLAPQVVSPAPLGLFHDLRWVVVYHESWLGFGLELAAAIVFRSVLDALIIREAWPEDRTPPSLAVALSRTLPFTAVAVVLLAPWVTLLFGLGVVSLSWLFFAAVPPVLIVALLTNTGAVDLRWWRRTVPVRTVGWVAFNFAVMSAASAVVSADPAVLAIPVAAAGGLFNAWAWRGVVGAVVHPGRSRRFRPVAPAGLAGIFGVAIVGTVIGFSVAGANAAHARQQARASGGPAPSRGRPVLLASGFGTKWDGRSGPWLSGPFDEERFSYAGLDRQGRPLPYTASDTSHSLAQLDDLMAAQVNALARHAHQRVSIVAASEASLVAETFLATHPHAPVSQVVLVSPLVRPGSVYYPPSGSSGWGLAGGIGLQALTDTLKSISPLHVSPSTPLFRSIVQDGPEVRTLLSCPVAGVKQVAVEPLADAVAAQADGGLGIPSVVVASFHSGVLGDASVDRTVVQLLDGSLPTSAGWLTWVQDAVRPAASAWQVPQLSLSVGAWILPARTSVQHDGSLACRTLRSLYSPSATGPGGSTVADPVRRAPTPGRP